MDDVVTTIEQLESLYGEPVPTSITKEVGALTSGHRAYIDASPFVIVATSGVGGLDCSPRGDPAGFVRIADDRTLLLPDRRGNNRVDTLRNIVEDPRIGLLFLIPGVGTTIRVNGTAVLSTDVDLRSSFAMAGKLPATVIVVTVESVYTQCPKALLRSHLWDPAHHVDPSSLPSPGDMHAEIIGDSFDGDAYDAAYPERVRTTMY
jgi:PPOX class probable FMN-dependent enzyme